MNRTTVRNWCGHAITAVSIVVIVLFVAGVIKP